MTAPRAALVPPRPPGGAPLRRAALLLGVLPTTVAILVITLGPPSLVAAGLAGTMDVVDRLDAHLGWSLDVDRVESLANTAMFVPLGAFLGLAVRPRSWPLVLLAGALLSVGVELAQTRLPGRVPDVHDVVANTAGDLVGLLAAMLVVGLVRLRGVGRRRAGGRRRGALPLLAAAALALVLALLAATALHGGAAVPLHLATGTAPAAPAAPASRAAALTAEDGWLADGSVSPFADDEAAIARLQPALRAAVQRAARDAEADGVEVVVTTGWRSAAYQQRLLDEAVARYGSRAAALRWVSTPQASQHVRGAAVDLGGAAADDWFLRNGARYGLCRTYANEPWHFELATTPGGTCPAELRDASAR